MAAFDDVVAFHDKFFPHTIAEKLGVPDDNGKMMEFRIGLIEEEFKELINAMRAGDLVKIADGCADLKYVVIGTEIVYGIPSDKVWDEVHASNMSKDINREGNYTGGKAVKGPNYFKPDIERILNL